MGNEKIQSELMRSNIHQDIVQLDDMECSDDEAELYPPSSLSSSPPRDFDVHPGGQYMPILDGNDDDDDDYHNEDQSSLASSLSLDIGASQPTAFTPPPPLLPLTTNSSRVIRCPVCEKPMRTFYCAKCILKGRFVTLDYNQRTDTNAEINTTDFTNSERNHNRRMTHPLEAATGNNPPENSTIDENKMLEEALQIKLRALTKRTEALEALYKDQKSKLEETRNILRQTRQQVEIEKKSYRAKESKIELIKRYISSRKASVKKRRDAEINYLDELKQHVSRRAYQLTQDIFPIDELNLLEQNSSFVNMETSPLLTFSDGSHHQIDQSTAYSIVEPWLPSDGDYSAYSLWVNDNKDQLQAPIDESPERNPALRIGAALAYSTQLVKNLASYLDVILPAKTDLDVFNRELLNDAEFSYNVAKLNTNVIHLCVSQGINISLLNSQRTLKNLLLLYNMNICDLGRKPIFELGDEDDDKIASKIESELVKDLSLVRDEFYDFNKFSTEDNDDDDVSDSEWEISDTINPIELAMAEQSIQQNSYISRPLRLFSSFWTASGN